MSAAQEQNSRDPRELKPPSPEDRAGVTLVQLRAQAELDHELIEHLQHDLNDTHAKIAGLEDALLTSRRIGAAVGIIMLSRKMTPAQAFRPAVGDQPASQPQTA